MKIFLRTFLLAALPALVVAQIATQGSYAGSGNLQAEARQIFALANEARTQAGVGRLDWDPWRRKGRLRTNTVASGT